jgi:hypothetical protein
MTLTPTPLPQAPVLQRRLAVLQPPILTLAQASARITAYVYGNIVVLGALLSMTPDAAVSTAGALTIVAAGVSTFIAHSFAEMMGHRVAHGSRSVVRAALTAMRGSLPIVSSAIVPIGLLAIGGWLGWPNAPVHLAAALFICARIGLIGATAERFRGRPSSRRFVIVGIVIGASAAAVAIAKVLVAS